MANSSYLNIITFLLTTVFYYMVLKPTFTFDMLTDIQKSKDHTSQNYLYLGVYLLLVMVIQFMVNASVISSSCGGNITENMGASSILTFLPWTFIFGAIILVLVVYPGFKSAFSDVIGYFYVYNSAGKVLTELMIDPNVQKNIDSTNSTVEQKQAMQSAADAIIKICGNTSILINEMVPSNFISYWNILKPLFKQQYQDEMSPDTIAKKTQLFELVVSRDNVGEAMWFIYIGILVTSIVQLKIITRGCVSSPETMAKNHDQFLKQNEEMEANKAKTTGTVYTLSG